MASGAVKQTIPHAATSGRRRLPQTQVPPQNRLKRLRGFSYSQPPPTQPARIIVSNGTIVDHNRFQQLQHKVPLTAGEGSLVGNPATVGRHAITPASVRNPLVPRNNKTVNNVERADQDRSGTSA